MFDELFHVGVNIIRGSNSSGKSTIADFIFYVLGGDFVQWKPEALRCDVVVAEVWINGEPAILRRYVTEDKHQPLEIFWGDYNAAMAANLNGWQRYPYARNAGKESFSQVLFRAIGFPEVTGDKDSNITMHQILRLLAVDQLSRVHSLMRDEQFDPPLTRRTIGDVLLGLYDDSLYSNQIRLRDLKRQLDAATSEQASLSSAFANTQISSDPKVLVQKEMSINENITKIDNAIIAAMGAKEESLSANNDELKAISLKLSEAQRERYRISNEMEKLKLEAEDSVAFISSLDSRLNALEESAFTEQALGQVLLHTCPECFQSVKPKEGDGNCKLCGQVVPPSGRSERMNRMRHELTTQIKESRVFLKEREKTIESTKIEQDRVNVNLAELQRNYNMLSQTVRSDRDRQLDEMLQRKGGLEQELRLVAFQRQLVKQLTDALARVSSLKSQITSVEHDVKQAMSRQDDRRLQAHTVVDRIARYFLHNDLSREEAFQVANEVVVDFDRNISEVDGRVNFSASSITYLRSSVNFALFFASLELPFFRYPRFIVNDNIEDKGMEEARSQNFQRLIVGLSRASAVSHQIIFTTSMIAPEFDNTELCVGEKYTITNKTLRFPDKNTK